MVKNTHILILEDSPADVQLIEAELREAEIDYTASVVSTKKDFVRQLEKFTPDLILSDYSLPQFDGISAIKIALKKAPVTPFIIVNSSIDEIIAVECMKAGAVDYVPKQRIGRLGSAIKNALELEKARSKQRRAEQAQWKSEELFRNLVENMSEMFYVVNAQGKLLYGSPNLYETFAYRPDELLGRSPLRFIYSGDRRRVLQFYKKRTLDGSRDTMVEFRAETKRGVLVWLEQVTRIVRDEDGAVVEYRHIARNITRRKTDEETLRILSGAVEQTADRVVITDIHGVIEYVNPAFESTTGYSKQFVIGKKLSILKSGRHKKEFYKELWDTILSKKTFRAEFTNRRKNGELYIEEQTISPILDSAGNILHFVSTARDITRRKKAEELLLFQARLLEQVHQAVFATDNQTNITYWNSFAEKMYGWSAKEVIGRNALELLVSPASMPTASNILRSVVESGSADGEFKALHKDGHTIPVQFNASRIKNDEGKLIGFVSGSMDITGRKRAETELKESESRYRMLFNSIPLPLWVFDLETLEFLAVNEAAMEHYGYSRDEFLSMKTTEIRPVGEIPKYLAKIKTVGETIKQQGMWKHKKKDGSLFDVEIAAQAITYEGRTALLVLANDVTEQKQAEEALKESEAKLKNIVESSTNLFYAHDTEHKLFFLSPQIKDILGYDVEEGLRRWTEFVSDNPVNEAGFQRKLEAINTAKPQPPYELELLHKSGRKVWVEVREAPVVKHGKTFAIVGSLTDITERKKTEEELHKQTSYFRQLFESSPAAIVMVDLHDHVLDINRSFTKLFQYTSDEIIGRSLTACIAAEDFAEEAQEYSLNSLRGSVVEAETVRKRKNGEAVEVALTSYPIVLDGKPVGVFAMYIDLSGRKKLEDQLRQSQKLESLGTLAGGIAHDFNNILGIILGHVTLLERIPAEAEKVTESTRAISRATQRGASLVQQLLTFARKADVLVQSVQVNDIVKEVEKLLRETFPKIIEVQFQLEEKLPAIIGDATQVHQVLLNLCVNARDAMLPQGGTLRIATSQVEGSAVRERLPAASAQRYICLRVSDTGSGMDEDVKAHMFEPFFTTKELGKGTGLGLSTVYGIIQNHDGWIDLDTAVGLGSTFYIYLPVKKFWGRQEEHAGRDTIERVAGGTETILLVEDEEMLRELVSTVLESKGYTVLNAGDGEKGLAMFREHHDKVALVLSDMGLPRLGGFDMFKKMKSIDPDVRAILASGYFDPGLKSEMLIAGIKELIQKPFDPIVLLEKIRAVLEGGKQVRMKS